MSRKKRLLQRKFKEGGDDRLKQELKKFCFICGEVIRPGHSFRTMIPCKKRGWETEQHYHDSCGPGSEKWLIKFGTELGWLSFITVEDRENELKEFAHLHFGEELNKEKISAFYLRKQDLLQFLTWRKEMKKEKAKKSGKGSGLIPKEKVVVPKELYEHPEIGKMLKKLDGLSSSDKDAGKIRRSLRAKGFKLSDQSTWANFMGGKKKGGKKNTPKTEETEAGSEE